MVHYNRSDILQSMSEAAMQLQAALDFVEYPNDVVYILAGWAGVAGYVGRGHASKFFAHIVGRRSANELPEDLAIALAALQDHGETWKDALPVRLALFSYSCRHWAKASDDEWRNKCRNTRKP